MRCNPARLPANGEGLKRRPDDFEQTSCVNVGPYLHSSSRVAKRPINFTCDDQLHTLSYPISLGIGAGVLTRKSLYSYANIEKKVLFPQGVRSTTRTLRRRAGAYAARSLNIGNQPAPTVPHAPFTIVLARSL